MSKNNELSGLINQLSRSSSVNLHLSDFLKPLTVIAPSSSRSPTSQTAASQGLKSLAADSSEKISGIQFGKPSNNNSSSSSSGTAVWQHLLSQTASGGLSSALTGGLSSIAGLGGLISSIANLFGGSSKAAPPPLVLFSLPSSIEQTAYVNSKANSVYGGDSTSKSGVGSAIYTTSGLTKNSTQPLGSAATDSAAIAQAVKNALLSSNTLGDVIAEI